MTDEIKTNVGPDQQEQAADLASSHAQRVAARARQMQESVNLLGAGPTHTAGPVCDRYEHHVHLVDGGIRTGGTHQPGDPHEYEITCNVCGQVGNVRLTVDPTVTP